MRTSPSVFRVRVNRSPSLTMKSGPIDNLHIHVEGYEWSALHTVYPEPNDPNAAWFHARELESTLSDALDAVRDYLGYLPLPEHQSAFTPEATHESF